MDKTRLEMLQSFVEKKPNDPFSWYGLAMEYSRLDQFDRAVETFMRVIQIDPLYSAAHYHQGQVLERQGKRSEARQVYRDGIAAAASKGDAHSQGELQDALDALSDPPPQSDR
ncbi:MAG: tetratricopeptide repeat protein [Acidobacteriota bacterium]